MANFDSTTDWRITHGLTYTRAHSTWRGMRQRCNNPREKGYVNYGGRGITVCERWNTFENFFADMGHPPANHSLDRINNDGPYSPENCRWATRVQQNNNLRRNHHITFRGETKSISQWARTIHIHRNTLLTRLRAGWDVARALTTPLKETKRARRG